jgi:hypothetical protein
MTDPFHDPRFPDRPQHQDFWNLVDVVNQLDARGTEDQQPLPEVLSSLEIIDTDSLIYMARMKAIQAGEMDEPEIALISMFVSAFAAGVLFERNRAQKASRPPIRTMAEMDRAIQQMQIDDAVEMLNHPRFAVVQYQGKGSAEEPAVYGPYTVPAEALADRDRRHQFALDNWASDILARYGAPVTLVVPLWSTTED